MAEGVPVISSNTGGIPEVNIHGYSGYLSYVGDVNDMANNAIQLLSSDENLLKFRQQALKRAKDFSIEKILPIYEDLYRNVIKTNKVEI